MKINNLLKNYNDSFVKEHGETEFVDQIPGWKPAFTKQINGIIACGWLENDDIAAVAADGLFVIDRHSGEIVHEDLETEARNIFASDNHSIHFSYKGKMNVVKILGLRTGDGNRLSNDWIMEIERVRYNICVPTFRSSRYVNTPVYFLKLNFLEYFGILYGGFSPSNEYFLIMGAKGIEVCRKIFE